MSQPAVQLQPIAPQLGHDFARIPIQCGGSCSKAAPDVPPPPGPVEWNTLVEAAAKAALRTYAFHATHSANVDSILGQGLQPRHGGTGAAAADVDCVRRSCNRVHYTKDVKAAERYMNYLAGSNPFFASMPDHPNPAAAQVLQIALSRQALQSARPDPHSDPGDRSYYSDQPVLAPCVTPLVPRPMTVPSSVDALVPGQEDPESVERKALASNMAPEAQEALEQYSKHNNLGRDDVLQLLKATVKSRRTSAILPNRDEGSFRAEVTPAGIPVPVVQVRGKPRISLSADPSQRAQERAARAREAAALRRRLVWRAASLTSGTDPTDSVSDTYQSADPSLDMDGRTIPPWPELPPECYASGSSPTGPVSYTPAATAAEPAARSLALSPPRLSLGPAASASAFRPHPTLGYPASFTPPADMAAAQQMDRDATVPSRDLA